MSFVMKKDIVGNKRQYCYNSHASSGASKSTFKSSFEKTFGQRKKCRNEQFARSLFRRVDSFYAFLRVLVSYIDGRINDDR